MRKVLLILLGLTILLALTYFCFQDKIETIKSDLEGKTNAKLLENNMDYAHAKLKGVGLDTTSTIRLIGVAPSEEAKEQAAAVAATTAGIMGVENWLIVENSDKKSDTLTGIEEEAISQNAQKVITNEPKSTHVPYMLSAQKYENGHLLLEGYINSKYEQQVLFTQVKKLFGKGNVTDQLKVKNEAPSDWNKVALLGISKLSRVNHGTLHIKDNNYSFQGYLQAENGQKKKEKLLQEIKQELSNYSTYTEVLHIEIEENREPAVEKFVEKVIPTKKERIDTKSQKVKKEKPAKIIHPKSMQECQKMLSKLSTQQKIYFEYNKATIQQKSIYALDNVLKVLHNCDIDKIKEIEVSGHTDSIGTDEYNKKLSQKRANSVKAYLVKKGVDKTKLKAIGYGEKKPIVSNMLKAGRAKNRRIEFKIKGVK